MLPRLARPALALVAALLSAAAGAQGAGGLYIADRQFGFATAVRQGLADNTAPGRFFVLVTPPELKALTTSASAQDAQLRSQAVARGAQFLVCRRDVQKGLVNPASLVPSVGIVDGWQAGSNAPGPGPDGLFPGERASYLPAAGELVRRIRSVCAT